MRLIAICLIFSLLFVAGCRVGDKPPSKTDTLLPFFGLNVIQGTFYRGKTTQESCTDTPALAYCSALAVAESHVLSAKPMNMQVQLQLDYITNAITGSISLTLAHTDNQSHDYNIPVAGSSASGSNQLLTLSLTPTQAATNTGYEVVLTTFSSTQDTTRLTGRFVLDYVLNGVSQASVVYTFAVDKVL